MDEPIPSDAASVERDRIITIIKQLRNELKQRYIQEDPATHELMPCGPAVAGGLDEVIRRIEGGT